MDDQNELFIVVDKNDHITGYKTRYECHHNKTLIHRAIGIMIFNDRGDILFQKRGKQKDKYPGRYTIAVSGHVSKGETYKQAAKREMGEEIGIKIRLRFVKKFLSESDKETEMDSLFTSNFNGPFKINHNEVESLTYVPVNKLNKILPYVTPLAIKSLKQLNLI